MVASPQSLTLNPAQRRLLHTIMRSWDAKTYWQGRGFPDTYLTWDFETTGTRTSYDLPLDFGYCDVRDGRMVRRSGILLNWYSRPDLVEPAWMDDRLQAMRWVYEKKGILDYPYNRELFSKRGWDPVKALKRIWQLFWSVRDRHGLFVGHGAYHFDAPLVCNLFRDYLGSDWEFLPNELIDTGLTEKALRSLERDKLSDHIVPREGETLQSFFQRCNGRRLAGVLWRTDVCVERYRMAERFPELDTNLLHCRASMDAYVCHLLLEDHRRCLSAKGHS
jgi:hypothetical protein